MSASAVAVRNRASRSRRMPVPEDLKRQVEVPSSNFVAMTRPFLKVVISKCSAGLEKDILLLLAMGSYGGSQNEDGTWNHPEFVELPASEVAEQTNTTEDGVEKAFAALEERKLIQCRKQGNTNRYRLCVENFETASEREARVLPRKPAARAESIQTVAPHEPLMLLPGAKSRPIALRDDLRVRFYNKIGSSLSVLPKLQGENLQILIAPSGEDKAMATSRTPVRTPAQATETTTINNPIKSKPEPSGVPDKALAEMREFLNRWCRPRLGPCDDHTAKLALKAKGAAAYEDCARRLNTRLPRLERIGWGLVVRIIGDVGEAAAKANDQRSSLSPEELTELEQFTERQKRRLKGS